MNAALCLPRHVPLVVATRGNAVESVHYGSIVVARADGALVGGTGDTDFPVFTRSTLKPFQALPFVAEGGPQRFGFSTGQVALMCASHSAEPRHVAAVSDMLARIGCSERDLQCGSHPPIFYPATGTPVPTDLVPTPLHHNCSGKHAGFLAWCRLHDEPSETYLDPDHPLQRAIRRTLAGLLDCGERELIAGTDGCGAPNYALPLAQLARAYAQLAAPTGDSEVAVDLRALFTAMTAHPEMVSGERRDDLVLMQTAPGEWVAKGGAEGVQALGIASRGLGIAVKIADGGARAVRIATYAVLDQLGLLPPDMRRLLQWRGDEIRNHAGVVTGRLVPVFRLA